MRLFVAVFPPADVQRSAASIIERLRSPGDGVSWVKPDNLHYTVRFIGEVGDDGARRVAESAREAVRGRAAFDGVLGGLGAFPNARRARVIWLGMTAGGPALVELAKALERSLDKRGFEPEGRGFSAHLTLGRVRDPRGDWTDRLASVGSIEAQPVAFRVDRLSVIESKLNPKGSIYTVREEARLEG
jgi:2'-5' RNA ligase